MKKKKHIQTEKERLYQEKMAAIRAEKAAAEKRHTRSAALVLLALALAFLIVSGVLLGLNIAKMRNYELNYIRTYGTIVDFKLYKTGNDRRYLMVFSYTYDGQTYRAEDWESYPARENGLLGESVEIYVNPNNPQSAGRVSTADGFSLMSVWAFAGAMLIYAVGMAVLLSVNKISFGRRTGCIWLPMIAFGFCYMLLLWLSLPNDGFSAIFNRIRGTWGAVIVMGCAVVAVLLDFILSRRRRKTKPRIYKYQ